MLWHSSKWAGTLAHVLQLLSRQNCNWEKARANIWHTHMQEEGIPSNKRFSGSGWGVHLTHWKMMLWKFYPPLSQPFFIDFNSSLDRLQKLLPGFCFPLSQAGNIKHRDVWYPPLWCNVWKQARLSLSAFHTASDGTLEVWEPGYELRIQI